MAVRGAGVAAQQGWVRMWASSVDVSYVGQHAYNQLFGTGFSAAGININSVDIGAAFLPQNQDPSLTASNTGGGAVVADLMRPYLGYSSITLGTTGKSSSVANVRCPARYSSLTTVSRFAPKCASWT